ncbi:MAG: DUF5337 family protein [Pseudomonadota bacterium]
MSDEHNTDGNLSRQTRIASIVIALTMILWMAAQWIGGKVGLETRLVFLFDLAALAGLAWALIVTWQVWRKRRGS